MSAAKRKADLGKRKPRVGSLTVADLKIIRDTLGRSLEANLEAVISEMEQDGFSDPLVFDGAGIGLASAQSFLEWSGTLFGKFKSESLAKAVRSYVPPSSGPTEKTKET